MSYKVELSDHFKKESKRLVKKYRSLKSELSTLFSQPEQNPVMGMPLGDNVYKIRLAITSKGKGKRGGARVITYVLMDDTTVVLLAIYDKGDKDAISDKEIRELRDRYGK